MDDEDDDHGADADETDANEDDDRLLALPESQEPDEHEVSALEDGSSEDLEEAPAPAKRRRRDAPPPKVAIQRQRATRRGALLPLLPCVTALGSLSDVAGTSYCNTCNKCGNITGGIERVPIHRIVMPSCIAFNDWRPRTLLIRQSTCVHLSARSAKCDHSYFLVAGDDSEDGIFDDAMLAKHLARENETQGRAEGPESCVKGHRKGICRPSQCRAGHLWQRCHNPHQSAGGR